MGRRLGKEIDANEMVATPDGFVRFGDLRRGDRVFDERGNPCSVLDVADQVPERMYRITFSDGSTIDAGGEHQWVTWTHAEMRRYTRRDGPSRSHLPPVERFPDDWAMKPSITTEQIRETLTHGKRGDLNHRVPLNQPLRLPEADLPIDPWVLGYWLGNGAARSGQVTTDIRDMGHVARIAADRGYPTTLKERESSSGGRAGVGSFGGLYVQLRSAGLLENKHIPTAYLWASEQQRRDLVAGLLDSDGYQDPEGQAEFCSMDRRLAEDFAHLARSLGARAKVYSGRATLNGVDYGEKSRVYFRTTESLFYSPRKRDAFSCNESRRLQVQQRMIKSIEPIGARPTRCITVDSPSRVYLIGRAMIPTHNSVMGGHAMEPMAFVPCAVTGKPQVGWAVGPVYADSDKEFRVVYDTFRKLGIDRESIKFLKNVDAGNLHILTSWGFELIGKSAAHPETLVGEGLNFAIMAEAGRHKRKTWTEYIRPALADRRGWAMLTGVPEGASETSLLYAMYQHGQSNDPKYSDWWSVRYPSWANNVAFPGGRNDPEILSLEALLTEDEFRRQICAEFVDHAGQVMQEWDDDIHLGDYAPHPEWPIYLAMDPGVRNPFRILFPQVDPFGNVVVLMERSYQGKDAVQVAEALMADPAAAALIRRARGMYSDPAATSENSIVSRMLKVPNRGGTQSELPVRLSLLRRMLKQRNTHLPEDRLDARRPQLVFDRSCELIAWEAREGYRWPETRREQGYDKENPIKGNDHSWEAMGRFALGHFGADYGIPGGSGSAISVATLG